ncbi:MAG: phosphatase, partial [Pseudomonadota bacterium]
RRTLLVQFKTLGGVGIEVVTGSHTSEQYGYWARRAAEHDLLASVGSDFHSPSGSYRDLGELPPLPMGCKPIWDMLSL